ncbi:hypothetical protein SAMN04488056_108189 [Cohaesibacter marisflavi]|uniref:Uncharacterized protein n=1 Tax=Cohaesibacter marisflavi TaxID=655353 RepID=A0A1I5ID09_9HYPH|nr:hypothetical protein [Cohaesibacter marisflavi]SFO58344.1 hypothetical protein SAMN04488056_108189 [Cohaesibacter marisflavi]
MSATDTNMEAWRIDRRVPLPLLLALALQAMAAVWWAASLEGRMVAIEAKYDQLIKQSQQVLSQDRRVTILETKIDSLSQDIKDLKNLIENRYRQP